MIHQSPVMCYMCYLKSQSSVKSSKRYALCVLAALRGDGPILSPQSDNNYWCVVHCQRKSPRCAVSNLWSLCGFSRDTCWGLQMAKTRGGGTRALKWEYNNIWIKGRLEGEREIKAEIRLSPARFSENKRQVTGTGFVGLCCGEKNLNNTSALAEKA